MAFRFRLDAVLDARARAEDDARRPYLIAKRSHERALAEARRLRADFERTGRTFASVAAELPAAGVRDALLEIDLIRAAFARCEVAVRAAAERTCVAEATYAAARRERRRLEALRDRLRAAFEREREERENLVLDDANGARHNAAILFASSFHN